PLTSFSSAIDYEVCPDATVPIEVVAMAENYNLADVTIAWFKDGDVITGETGLTLPVLEGGVYSIEVTFNDTGCFNTTDITVIELPFCEFPQGISPGELDGLNDRFDLSNFNVVQLDIYNRHGRLVYSKSNYTDQWYGQTDDGKDLPVGTYFYSVVYEGGAKRKTAWVYINR
ncbi:gliding motility-associated C-terminal domain-containing protein, partial [Ichthyenterobacterium sp. W332]